MVGQKFRNNREGGKDYGRVATVVRFDEKAKSAVLEYADGKGSIPVSTATLKRWWKKIQEEDQTPVEAVVDAKNEADVAEPDVTDVASDGTPYSEVMQDIINDGKKAKKKAVGKQAKKSSSVAVETAQQLIIEQLKKAGFDGIVDEKSAKSVWVFVNGKKRCGIYVGGGKCSLGLSKTLAPNSITADRVRNCPNSHVYDIKYDNISRLTDILSSVDFDKKEDK